MKFSFTLLKQMVPALPAKRKIIDELNLKSFEIDDLGGDILNIEIPNNRYSDAASHLGVAREAAAILKLKVKEPAGLNQPLRHSPGNKLKVRIVSSTLCQRYGALYCELPASWSSSGAGKKIGQSPVWLQKILTSCGLKPINVVVDIMNYVMLEIGQPLHAFDAEKLDKEIVVRPAKKGEEITTLDNQSFELDEGVLVIADAKEPVGLAGIKGGKKAEVTSKTRKIIVEAANFDRVNIYQTSRKLGLLTDASVRFSHDLSLALVPMGLGRAGAMLKELVGAKVLGSIDINKTKINKKIIGFSAQKFNDLIGLPLKKEEVIGILQRLGFKILLPRKKFDFLVEAPAVRTDINIFEDLVEEVARLYDYNKIPAKAPLIWIEPAEEEDVLKVKDKIRSLLVGFGFSEIYNYSFSSTGDKESFELENPIASDKRYLRQNLIEGLTTNIQANKRFFEAIRIFEIGKVFNRKNKEELHLGLALRDKDNPFLELKGVIEYLLQHLGVVDLFFSPKDWGLNIESDGEILGIISLHKDSVVAEINLDKLTKVIEEEFEFSSLPKYPAVMRDLSLAMQESVQVGDILNAIQTAPAKDVRDVDLIDYYDPKRFTFRIVFQSDRKTLTDREVNKEMEAIIKFLKRKFWLEVR